MMWILLTAVCATYERALFAQPLCHAVQQQLSRNADAFSTHTCCRASSCVLPA